MGFSMRSCQGYASPAVCFGYRNQDLAKQSWILIQKELSFWFFLLIIVWNIIYYIITQVILAFWLVLAYDLLADRRTIDVIITKFFPPCLKMAESFENLDNILHDWTKDKVQKSIVDALNRY